MSKARKIIEDVRQSNGTEVDLVDKGIVNITEVPGLCKYSRTVGVYGEGLVPVLKKFSASRGSDRVRGTS